MTTYNTYQEAKIANPESNIYIHTGEFWCEKSIRPSSWTHELRGFKLCNPADYCMTVEKFLADGYKLVEGDVLLTGDKLSVKVVGRNYDRDDMSVATCNTPMSDIDCDVLILRAAALEEKDNTPSIHPDSEFYKKPRTKIEYVKSDIESRGRALDAFDGEVELFELVDGEYKQVTNESDAISKWRNLYERIETPMTWKEELYNYLDNSCEMSDDFDYSFTIEIEGKPLEFNLNDDEFVDMCKFVASLNSVN